MSNTQQHPKVRAACEECHSRKTKCYIPPSGGSCQACLANGRTCYFFPRIKPGRPRLDPREESSSEASSPPRRVSDTPGPSNVSSRRRSETGQSTPSEVRFAQQEWLQNSSLAPLVSQQHPSLQTTRDFRSNEFVDPRFLNQPNAYSVATLAESTWNTMHISSPSAENTSSWPVWSGYAQTTDYRSGEEPTIRLGNSFAYLTKLCSDLQSHFDELTETRARGALSTLSDSHLSHILHTIDTAGRLCYGLSSLSMSPHPAAQPNLDLALMTLIISSELKIFDLCDILVKSCFEIAEASLALAVNHHILSPNSQAVYHAGEVSSTHGYGGQESTPPRPPYILLMKRLDFYLVQAGISLGKIGQARVTLDNLSQDASGRASRIHYDIKTLVEGSNASWYW